MLNFLVYEVGKPATQMTLRNTYLVGSDGSAIRGDIRFKDGMITCEKKESGPASLAVQYEMEPCGVMTVQTTLLPDREEPYLLSLELARHRLMTLYTKMEDWGLFDVGQDHPVSKRLDLARRLFVEALCHLNVDMSKCDKFATDCLIASVDGSEELALTHAELLLNKRKETDSLPKFPIGCGVPLSVTHERVRAGLANNFDFVHLPANWRELAPEEGEYNWNRIDAWVEWARQKSIPVLAGPVVCFEPSALPDWVYIWEHDYDTLRDLLYEHTERVVTRYAKSVNLWNVVSGLHINNHFGFSFDQLLDLSRMATLLAKDIAPASKVMVEIRQPFGEYYAKNQKSIPPLMYADLLIQGAVAFDGFSVRLIMGQAQPGQYARDLMQISSMLDQFASFNKPMFLTIAVPSDIVTQMMLPGTQSGEPVDPNCGSWRKPWSGHVQAHWLEAMMHIALSKPYIEGVVWQEIVDHPGIELPLAGLMGEDLSPKHSFKRLAAFRSALQSESPLAPTLGSSVEQIVAE